MPTFFLPSISVFPASPLTVMDIAMEAGYDGLELWRFRCLWRYPSLARYRREAAIRGLELRFHEALAWDSDSTHPEIRIPALWGGLLRSGALLEEQFLYAKEPVVAYARHWAEVARNKQRYPNWTLQTVSTMPNGLYDLPYAEFEQAVQDNKILVTLDTQHLLEYVIGKPGVENLMGISRAALMQRIVDFFDKYHHLIREIHLNNFDPAMGHRAGRNLWPNEGVLDLRAFCQHVKASGWEGAVTPELHPRLFSRYSKRKNIKTAERLLEQVKEYWI